MRSTAHVHLIGHVAALPESTTRHDGLGGHRVYTTFPLATKRDTTSAGLQKHVTDYHTVVLEGTPEDHPEVQVGATLSIRGHLINRAYEKDGERKYVPEIHADGIAADTEHLEQLAYGAIPNA